VVQGSRLAELDVKAASIVMKKMWLIGVLAFVSGAGSIGTAGLGELCQVVGSGNRIENVKWIAGIADGGKSRQDSVAVDCNQPVSGVQGFSADVSNAELGGACADHPVELYFDDTWEGYRGTWLVDCRASQWTVLLTLMSSVFVSVAGYWLFGLGYAKRSGD
jgi:hypothetical protein